MLIRTILIRESGLVRLTKVGRNTTNAYMSVFRQHFNKLVVKGVIETLPFISFKIIEEEDSEQTTLTIGFAFYTPPA